MHRRRRKHTYCITLMRANRPITVQLSRISRVGECKVTGRSERNRDFEPTTVPAASNWKAALRLDEHTIWSPITADVGGPVLPCVPRVA